MSSEVTRRSFVSGLAALPVAGLAASTPWSGAAQAVDESLIVHTKTPMNAEPQLVNLVKKWVTPNEQFYIRSHAPNPVIDPDRFRLRIEGLVERPFSMSLSELANDYTSVRHMATLTCAGNRRSEHSRISPVKGVPWREGAIGNAMWSGVPLSAILKRAGVKQEARHVWFEGLDKIPRDNSVIPFGGSIPIEKALDDSAQTPGAMVVTEMNGERLSADHGFPVRTVVPGYIGARSVKWLGRIVVSNRPSPNHYVATAYKLVERGDAIEWAEKGPIYRYVLNSVICTPIAGAKVKPGRITVRGYALPHGETDRFIDSVEISADKGQNWVQAEMTSASGPFCWRLWKAEVTITPNRRHLMVRATDSAGKTQPQTAVWNQKGYLFNAWHTVELG